MPRALTPLVCVGLVFAALGCGDNAGAPAHASGGSGPTQAQGGTPGAGGSAANGAGTANGGAAACVAPHLTCDGAGCIDPATSDQHCGACNAACTAGKHCMLGKCECAAGQTACGESCVDLMTSTQSCGACNMACAAEGMCKAGHCVAADGCFGPAHDITISRLVAYQTLSIPLMKDGTEVATSDRNADLVADRETLLRVFVTPGAGFVSRELSARIHVTNDAMSKDIFVKGTPKTAVEAELSSTFNLTLPRELVKAGTRYSVELAECGDSQGTLLAPRFPATGDSALGARATGKLKLHFVPVHVGNQAPDVSDTRLAYHKAFFEALYPITDFEFTLGNVYSVNSDPNFDNLLDDIRDLRAEEEPEDDVYYFALSPVPSSDGSSDGVGFQTDADDADYRVAIGTSSDDAEYTSLVVGHEVGHNQGLPHSPGCDPGEPDLDFPYKDGKIGIWGYDRRKKVLVSPDDTWDIMAYCEPVWFSDYTYQQVLDRVAHVNGNQHVPRRLLVKQAYRVLLVAADGQTRWGHPYTGRRPSRAPEPGTVLDAQGNAVATVNVYRIVTDAHHATSIVIPSPAPGWVSVQLSGLAPVAFE